MSPSLGVVFLPDLPPERLRSVACAADAAGLEELWLWEDCFRESGIAAASAALAWTERLHVGVGLLPVPLRNVALTAMELATLSRLFPGRFRAGVGHGVQEWMGQVGARVESPLTLLREYLTALRALLNGETVTTSGRYVNLDAVALDWPPSPAPPLLAGAIGPKSLAVCGALADGTILTGGTSPSSVRTTRTILADAGASADHRVTVYLIAATGPDADDQLARDLRRWNLDPASDCAVAGDAHTVAAAVNRWAEAGADTVVLQPTRDDTEPERFIEFVATEVRPLI